MHSVKFEWTISFGHILQLLGLLFVGVSLYYGMREDILINARDIQANRAAIVANQDGLKALRSETIAMNAQLRKEAAEGEARIMEYLRDVKDDVKFLVKQQVNEARKQ